MRTENEDVAVMDEGWKIWADEQGGRCLWRKKTEDQAEGRGTGLPW